MHQMLHEIKLNNFLSFGPEAPSIELKPLNVIIGPNGSGKSNFLEAIDLLRCTPTQLVKPIREGGGAGNWLWKGTKGTPEASIEVIVNNILCHAKKGLRYRIKFTAINQRFELVDEIIEAKEKTNSYQYKQYLYYEFNQGRPTLNYKFNEDEDKNNHSRRLQIEDINADSSILAQRQDPEHYLEITHLGRLFRQIRIYREWQFGRYTTPRMPQKVDLPNDFLEPDADNLGMMLNRFQNEPEIKNDLLEELRELYSGLDDFGVLVENATGQVFLHEGRKKIPATRLSDGTLRYLCLLVILCHPQPPPLVCIEEPELGLHPDVLPKLAKLMKKASKRCQIIVTTHSDMLVDAMTDCPEAILVAEKDDNGTTLTRLEPAEIEKWLEKYRLGELWLRGDIGGTRW